MTGLFLCLRYWNKDIWTGLRRTLIQGQTTPETKDGLKLNMTGLLYYDPTLQVGLSTISVCISVCIYAYVCISVCVV